jgi:hypothetical protein
VTEDEVTESVPSEAVRVADPAVLRVTANDFTPLESVEAVGRVAAESEEVRATVPAYPVAVLPAASLAVTVIEKLDPEVLEAGTAVRTKEVAAAGFTVRLALVETAAPDTVAPRVTDPEFSPVKLAVKTPEPAFVIEPKDPVPPTALEVKRIAASAGKPDGFKLP